MDHLVFDQGILVGSSIIAKSQPVHKDNYILDHFVENHAFSNHFHPEDKENLNRLKKLYSEYRASWFDRPAQDIARSRSYLDHPPLCVDIEVASICDLACPYCFRSSLYTPDRLIEDSLAFSIIDQAADMGVPSIKFNWRGEPLLHPRLETFISYAKTKGILETIINTNATHLTTDRAISLIRSGLDVLIYSFDGGTRSTYEKNRPGRWNSNSFDDVVNNIHTFNHVRKKLKRHLPFTKIQMILTQDTRTEQDEFLDLFSNHVDSVSVTQLTERGSQAENLSQKGSEKLDALLDLHGIDSSSVIGFLEDSTGCMSIATERRPCNQPFQRLLITYDGRVSMCCYDWGAKHSIGYLCDLRDKHPNYDKLKVQALSQSNTPGFTAFGAASMPDQFTDVDEPSTLRQIWNSATVITARKAHLSGSSLPAICKTCSFKDTYNWLS